MTQKRWLGVAVAGHILATSVHGTVHGVVPVHVHDWQYVFAAVVIVLAPLVGLLLVLRGRERSGGVTIACAALAAVAFESIFHFVVQNPDHVGTVVDGRATFEATALLSTAADLVVFLTATWFLLEDHRIRLVRPSTDRQ